MGAYNAAMSHVDLTPRQRLLAVLRGEPCDRVPTWLLFPYHRLGCYVDVRTNPCYRAIHQASLRQAVTLNRRHLSVRLFAPEVTAGRAESVEDGAKVVREWIEHNRRRLTSERRTCNGQTQVRARLRTVKDLEAYLTFPVNTDAEAIRDELETQLANLQREIDEFPRDAGAMMLDLGEPINPLYHAADLTEFPLWSLTHEDAIAHWLDAVMQQKRIVYQWCLERRLADVYFLVGSELAAPPMVSPQTFRRWIVPYARELIALIREAGALSIQHFHGQIRQLLPDFVAMAPDGLHTIEAPPVGNCTLDQAWEVVTESMALIGNIQYDEFRSHTPEQMRRAVRAVIDEAAGRRFILSPTAGPYEEHIPRRVIENYLAFLDEGWWYGRLT